MSRFNKSAKTYTPHLTTIAQHESALEGVVMKKSLGTYWVEVEGDLIVCNLSSKLRKVFVMPEADPSSIPRYEVMAVKDIRTVDPVAIGDRVRFTPSTPNGMITDVLPRRNQLSRLAQGGKPLEQVIAANVDQLIAVIAAAEPEPRWNTLDRYLVTAAAADIPAIICVTKCDLAADSSVADEVAVYRRLGYQVLMTSVNTGEGIDTMRDLLRGRTSVMMGRSGVGKTSLLNGVQPELGLKVGIISKKLKEGKHTTTHLEMLPLDFGGALIDTPGMREFHVWLDENDDPAMFFPEMAPFVGTCKFGLDCTHRHEPSCTILAALGRGEITRRRYESCLQLNEG